ncbi:MAG: protein kinase, partial [archaeon]|nr:protein kinase [archaeon]
MGSQFSSKYNIEKEPFLTAGHLKLWKIYRAISKENGEKVCLFSFDKSQIKSYSKSEKEIILELLRNEAKNLIKYKHPNILSIVEPLVEDKYSLVFITEDITYSLDSLIKDKNSHSELELLLIIRELFSTVNFIHEECKMIHCNLSPDCIFLDSNQKIKLSGLQLMTDIQTNKIDLNNKIPLLNPDLIFSAPELNFNSQINKKSDIYSLGLIIYFMLSEGNLLIRNLNSNLPFEYKKVCYNSSIVNDGVKETMSLNKNSKKELNLILSYDIEDRPEIKDILSNYSFLHDRKIQAVEFMDNLATNDVEESLNFLKNFKAYIKLFDTKTITHKFLPNLLKNIYNESLMNAIIPFIFYISEESEYGINFYREIWPKINQIFMKKTLPATALYFLLNRVIFLGMNISKKEFDTYIMSFICRALDCGVAKIQNVVIKNALFICNICSKSQFENMYFPKIILILINSKNDNLMVNIIFSLIKIKHKLQEYDLLNDKLLSLLEAMVKRDKAMKVSYAIIYFISEIFLDLDLTYERICFIQNLIYFIIWRGKICKS